MKTADQQRLQRLDHLAELLDESIRIPGIGYRIGYDAIIGLLPGIGDVAGLVFGSYIVVEAARFKIPRSTLFRMIANVLLEAFIGAIPLVGDLFDATYKSNLRNLNLLHDRIQSPERAHTSDRWFFVVLIGLPVAAVVALVAFLIWIVALLF